tara:strand:- start:1713 stop:3635 length:1923 start_codon:yes stop_codon:yes gene_type:complete
MTSVKPKRPVYWIPDSTTDSCKLCNTKFGYLLRKHHCRKCGFIFCGSCAGQFGSIPSYLGKTLHYSDVGNKVRLCKTCLVDINTAKKSRKLVEIVSFLPLNLYDYHNLRVLSKKWLSTTNYILGVIKGIQYKIPYDKYSKLERRIIKRHWKSFTGHSTYMKQVLRCLVGIVSNDYFSNVIRHYKNGVKVVPCNLLNCEKCNDSFTVLEVLEILYGFHGTQILDNAEAEVYFGTILVKVDIDWLSVLIPYFLSIGTTEACQRVVHNYILPRILEDKNFLFKFYYECRLCRDGDTRVTDYYVSLMERVLQLIDQSCRDELTKCDLLIHYLENPHVDKQEKINELCPIVMPYNTSLIIQEIHLGQMRQLATFTKPYLLPITTNVGRKNILLKKEDLRKDRLVVIIKYILGKSIPNILLSPYSIFPIHGTYGWIEMIPNVETLYDIQEKSTLQNYILEKNSTLSILQIRRNFIQSCASNALLTYMVGVGDRNLHNILVKPTGDIVNIDFSYLLGDDPKFKTNTMSITPQMVEVLGGHKSEGYHAFQTFCTQGFSKIRQLSSFWFILFLYLAKTKPPILKLHNNVQHVRKFHEERLMCNMSEEESTVRIAEIVDQNSSSSWHQTISDYSHTVATSITNFMFELDI